MLGQSGVEMATTGIRASAKVNAGRVSIAQWLLDDFIARNGREVPR